MSAPCTALRAAARVYVVGLSTTGGGHERVAGVVGRLEAKLAQNEPGVSVAVIFAVPEPWRGKVQQQIDDASLELHHQPHSVSEGQLDHTGSVLAKLRDAVQPSPNESATCSYSFLTVPAAKTVTGFYRSDGHAPAWDLIWDLTVLRPGRKALLRTSHANTAVCYRPSAEDGMRCVPAVGFEGDFTGAALAVDSPGRPPKRRRSEEHLADAGLHLHSFDPKTVDFAKLTYQDVLAAQGRSTDRPVPSAVELLAFITQEMAHDGAGSKQCFVLTDMDPDLTSAAVKLQHREDRCNVHVHCLDYENHQDLALASFGIHAAQDLRILEANFRLLHAVMQDADLSSVVFDCMEDASDVLAGMYPNIVMKKRQPDRVPLAMTLSLEYDKLVSGHAAERFLGSEARALKEKMPFELKRALEKEGYDLGAEGSAATPAADTEDLICLCTLNRVRRALVKSCFLLKVLNMGKFGAGDKAQVAHVDIVEPGLRRFPLSDVERYGLAIGKSREEVIGLLRECGEDLLAAGERGAQGVAWFPAAEPAEVVYVYAHNSAPLFLEYLKQKTPQRRRSILFVFCGAKWHRRPEDLATDEQRAFVSGFRNVMRTAQLALQGHAVITAGAGACGEYCDTNLTFPGRKCFLLPLAGQKEQFFNGVLLQKAFPEDVIVCHDMDSAWQPAFERFLDGVVAARTSRSDATSAVQQLLAKQSVEAHAAELLFATNSQSEPVRTSKEQLIHEFSRVLERTGISETVRGLRRKLKLVFQAAEGLRLLLADARRAGVKDLSDVQLTLAVTGKGGSEKFRLAEALTAVVEQLADLELLGVDTALLGELKAVGVEMAAPGCGCSFSLEHLTSVSEKLNRLARESSDLFLTGF